MGESTPSMEQPNFYYKQIGTGHTAPAKTATRAAGTERKEGPIN